jgi:large subunit ribosomal protein L30
MTEKRANRGAGRAAAGGKRLRVTLMKSTVGFDRKQAAVVRGLGLRRIRHTVDLLDTPATRGMILKVRHLVQVNEMEPGSTERTWI